MAASRTRRLAPAVPGATRLSILAGILILGWALLIPSGHRVLWWHLLIAAVAVLVVLASWQGHHLTSIVRLRTTMALHNYRLRNPRRGASAESEQEVVDREPDGLSTSFTLLLRPPPHMPTTSDSAYQQLPWALIVAWLDRYGVHARSVYALAETTTPAPSHLRRSAGAAVGAEHTQHHNTWLTYTFDAVDNLAAMQARRADLDAVVGTVSRRLLGELREQGWQATIVDDDELPSFLNPRAPLRRESWTAAEYVDGYRSVYRVRRGELAAVMADLVHQPTINTWVGCTISARDSRSVSVRAHVATRTPARPENPPTGGLEGFDGRHSATARDVSATVPILDVDTGDVMTIEQLAQVPWAVSAPGVPIGTASGRTVYLPLASQASLRINIEGTSWFHKAMITRLALSGLPIALYVATEEPAGGRHGEPTASDWSKLINAAAPQQISLASSAPSPGGIVVADGSRPAPAGHIMVALLRPRAAGGATPVIVLKQHAEDPELLTMTTPAGRVDVSSRFS